MIEDSNSCGILDYGLNCEYISKFEEYRQNREKKGYSRSGKNIFLMKYGCLLGNNINVRVIGGPNHLFSIAKYSNNNINNKIDLYCLGNNVNFQCFDKNAIFFDKKNKIDFKMISQIVNLNDDNREYVLDIVCGKQCSLLVTCFL